MCEPKSPELLALLREIRDELRALHREIQWQALGVNGLTRAALHQLGNLPPTPPVYALTTVAGETEYHPHNESTLRTEADRRAWAEYQDRLRQWREISQRNTGMDLNEFAERLRVIVQGFL